jgi:hypothetical protein
LISMRKPAITFVVVIILVVAGLDLVDNRPLPSPSSPTTSIIQLRVCQAPTGNQTALNEKALSRGTNATYYDEQLWLGFERNFTSLSYNVTAVEQSDTFGNGPWYLLNGLTTKGIWYQVGVSWNKFYEVNDLWFISEVWNATSRKVLASTLFPLSPARANDSVGLSLVFEGQDNVVMKSYDWRTEAKEETTYFAYGATQFVSNGTPGFFPTSLLTEWHLVTPYYCSNLHVVFSNKHSPMASAWMRIDEWNFTGTCNPQRADLSEDGQCFVFFTPSETVHYSQPSTLLPFSADDTVIYSNSTSFITM